MSAHSPYRIGSKTISETGLADGFLLKWNAATARWIPTTAALHGYHVGTYSANTTVREALAVWNYGTWFIVLPRKGLWDFSRHDYYFTVNGFKTVSGTGYAKLYWYNHATGVWTALASSLVTIAPFDTYRTWTSGVLDMSAVADEDDLYWSVALLGDGAGYTYMGGAAVLGVPK